MISKMKCSVLASMTLARNASASRSVSTRASPVPDTLTSASSRSSGVLLPELDGAHRQVDDAVHRHDALELVLDLLQHVRRAARHDGDARQVLFMLGLRNRQALDVVAAAGKQSDDACQHAGLVVDQHRKRVVLGLLAFPWR